MTIAERHARCAEREGRFLAPLTLCCADVLIGINALIIHRSVASVKAQIVIEKVTSHLLEPCP